jgi:hypothetical protein
LGDVDDDPEVIGFYRLWGNYEQSDDHWSDGYNIYTNPGYTPVANKDKNGYKYEDLIHDYGTQGY